MNYNEFVSKIHAFKSAICLTLDEKNEYTSDVLFFTSYRRIFALYDQVHDKLKLTIEVMTIPTEYTKSRPKYEQMNLLVKNMIEIGSYLLQLQQEHFLLDVLPEEGIWYATIEISNSTLDERLFNLLKLDKTIM